MRGSREIGSALMLVPAGILVLMVLGAIAVDSAIAFLAQRELAHQSAAAVNDAVTVAIPPESLQRGELARPDAAVAVASVHRSLDGLTVGGLVVRPEHVVVTVDEAAGTVAVVVEGDVPYLFAKGVPGARSHARVRAAATAELRFTQPA